MKDSNLPMRPLKERGLLNILNFICFTQYQSEVFIKKQRGTVAYSLWGIAKRLTHI